MPAPKSHACPFRCPVHLMAWEGILSDGFEVGDFVILQTATRPDFNKGSAQRAKHSQPAQRAKQPSQRSAESVDPAVAPAAEDPKEKEKPDEEKPDEKEKPDEEEEKPDEEKEKPDN